MGARSFQGDAAMPRVHAASGYTVVELVLVITILGIVLGFAVPRFFDNALFAARGYADELAAALRYAQKVAVASGCRVRVRVDASGYALDQQRESAGSCDAADTSWSTPVRHADGQLAVGATPADVAVAVAAEYVFDPAGTLESGTPASFTVGARTLSIDPDSGFVRLQ
jgi:MSHA pilin protein MshC